MSRPKVNYLVLWLTNACNLRCSYCYCGEIGKPERMSFETLESALDLARGTDTPLHIQMAGGEPTLEPESIQRVLAITSETRWKRPTTIGLQTNGTLIDPKLARLCREHHIDISISLDGLHKTHDQLRGSFAQTIKGLKVLESHRVPCRMVTTLTKINVSELPRLALLLSGFSNVRGMGLSLIVRKGRASVELFVDPEELKSSIRELLEVLKHINARRKPPLQLRELDEIEQARSTGHKIGICHACQGTALAIHPSGKAYTCSQTIGDEQFLLGSVHSNIDWDRARLPGKIDPVECQNCTARTWCEGDCRSRLHYNSTADLASRSCLITQTLSEHFQEIQQ